MQPLTLKLYSNKLDNRTRLLNLERRLLQSFTEHTISFFLIGWIKHRLLSCMINFLATIHRWTIDN